MYYNVVCIISDVSLKEIETEGWDKESMYVSAWLRGGGRGYEGGECVFVITWLRGGREREEAGERADFVCHYAAEGERGRAEERGREV